MDNQQFISTWELKSDIFLVKFISILNGDFLCGMITSSFLHADFFHLLGNMYFLWIFGSAVELCIGSGIFVSFILGCSLFTGVFFHMITSEAIFSLGASGFVFGLMGLFLTLCSRVKVKTLFIVFYHFRVIDIPSWLLISFFIAKELYSLVLGASGGVNVVAHLSGAAFGIILGLTLLKRYRFS